MSPDQVSSYAVGTTKSSFPLEELSWEITKSASIVSQYIHTSGLPQPSFARNGPDRTVPRDSPLAIRQARQNLLEAALKIFRLASGPREFLSNLSISYQEIACLRWLCHFKIIHLVPGWELENTGPTSISYTDLAAKSGVPEKPLKSVVRIAATAGLLAEPRPGFVAHSAISALLARDAGVFGWATWMCSTSTIIAASMTDAHMRWPGSTRVNQTAYSAAFDTELPFFEHISLDPQRTAEFASYMKILATSDGVDINHLLNAYDWAAIKAGTVVDVGGSRGNAAVALAKSFSQLDFVVQDLPANVEAGREAIASTLEPNVASRITFQSHDFMQPQPVQGASVYMLRLILHDWPLSEAATIVRQIVRGMKRGAEGSRLIIMDTVLPTPGSVPASVERHLRFRDLTMMQTFNAQERDLEDWQELLKVADERLELVNVVQPFGSAMAGLEVMLK